MLNIEEAIGYFITHYNTKEEILVMGFDGLNENVTVSINRANKKNYKMYLDKRERYYFKYRGLRYYFDSMIS